MIKVKFNSLHKRKGIVEEVFVTYGQPIKQGNELAKIALSDGEIVAIKAVADGVIGDIKVVESVIVKPGDAMFEILSSTEVEKLTRKPKKISTTLLQGLERFGFISNNSEEILNEFESDQIEEQQMVNNQEPTTDSLIEETIIDESFLKTNLVVENQEQEKPEKGSMTIFIDEIMDNKTAIFGPNDQKPLTNVNNSDGEMHFINFNEKKNESETEQRKSNATTINDEIDMTWSNLEINLENIQDDELEKSHNEVFEELDKEILNTQSQETFNTPFAKEKNANANVFTNFDNEPVTVSESITEELQIITDLNSILSPTTKIQESAQITTDAELSIKKVDNVEELADEVENKILPIITTESELTVNFDSPSAHDLALESWGDDMVQSNFQDTTLYKEELKVNESNHLFPNQNNDFGDGLLPKNLDIQVEDLTSDQNLFDKETRPTSPTSFTETTNHQPHNIKIPLTEIKQLIDDKFETHTSDWKVNFDKLVLDHEVLVKKVEDIEINNQSNDFTEEFLSLKTEQTQLAATVNKLNNANDEIGVLKQQYADLKDQNSKVEAELQKLITNNNINQSLDKSAELQKDINTTNSNISFEVDITALLNLHVLMYEPFKEQGIDLELSAFYVKALKIVLEKSKIFTKSAKAITLAKVFEKKFAYKKININQDQTIMELAKQTLENKFEKKPSSVTLYDFGRNSITTAKIQLPQNVGMALVIGDVHSKIKDEKLASDYVNVSITFDQSVIAIEDAIEFTHKFNEIINNPGLLI